MPIVGLDPSFTSCGISDGSRHEIIHTDPVPGVPEEEGLLIRCWQISIAIEEFIKPFKGQNVVFYCEAPMLRVEAHGGSHLYQVGWFMHMLASLSQRRTYSGEITRICYVTNGTLLKTVLGRGNLAKSDWAKEAYKQHGFDNANDRGSDKLVAFLLWRYGTGCANGEYRHTDSERVRRGGAKRLRATAEDES
jgi:hypothetical protein